MISSSVVVVTTDKQKLSLSGSKVNSNGIEEPSLNLTDARRIHFKKKNDDKTIYEFTEFVGTDLGEILKCD